ncbi:phage portal protein [Paenibacillus psychroresistens]|uniref:Phage portal protein n=1 Tax=Paenibacillus psychroresistens TaxID=1778678 RepID=A0A6B8REL3_9BACL|nr:phage portal protein [Paenibacillus psychroresistens]QGQ93953.1 phage portal protein [Paenibacillus psychroresistens]
MSNLNMFFAENAQSDLIEDFIVSERFKDEKSNPVAWKLRTLTEAENADIRASATKRVQVKRGVTMPETNPNEYMAKLIVASVVYPNLKDADLQKSYGVLGAENLVRTMLIAGEYSTLAEKVQTINGFDKDLNDLVEEAKN